MKSDTPTKTELRQRIALLESERTTPPSKCDCLNHCGDDPWLKSGKAVPCERAQQQARDEQARAEQLQADTLTLNGLLARLRRASRCREEVAALERLMSKGLW